MAASASVPTLACFNSSACPSSVPISSSCRRVGLEPLTAATISLSSSALLRRPSSSTRRSQKAMHRAAIRRIITVSTQQQQQQQQRQQQQQQRCDRQEQHSTCRSMSAPQLSLSSSDLSRLGMVTQAVLKDHRSCLSNDLFDSNGHRHQKQSAQHLSLISPTTALATPPKTKPKPKPKYPLPPSITTRRNVSNSPLSSCSPITSNSSASSNSTAYYSMSSTTSPLASLHYSRDNNINTIQSSSSSSSSSFSSSPVSCISSPSVFSSSSCSNITCNNNLDSTSFNNSSYLSPSTTRSSGSTTLCQRASYQCKHIHQRSEDRAFNCPKAAPVTITPPWHPLYSSLLQDRKDKIVTTHKEVAAEKTAKANIHKSPSGILTNTRPCHSSTQQPSKRTGSHHTPSRSIDSILGVSSTCQPNPQKSEYSDKSDRGNNDDDLKCFFSAINGRDSKECIQDINVSFSCRHPPHWSPSGVTKDQDLKTIMDNSAWPQHQQHIIHPLYFRNRSRDKSSRRHKIGAINISIQRRSTLRRLQQQQLYPQSQEDHSQQNQGTTQFSLHTQRESGLLWRQSSVRYMRYLSTKPLPVLSRSASSTSRNRKRLIGPISINNTASRCFRSVQLNKPLPPIPNTISPNVNISHSSNKEHIDDIFTPQDSYHEANSSMIGYSGSNPSDRWSKQELQETEGSKSNEKTIDSDILTVAMSKQDLASDHANCVDRSVSKEELISNNTLDSTSTTIPKSKEMKILPPSDVDKPKAIDYCFKEEINRVNVSSTLVNTETTFSSIPFSISPTAIISSPGPTSLADQSLTRLESFYFPTRDGSFEDSSISKNPVFHHHQRHSHPGHHRSLPQSIVNTTQDDFNRASKISIETIQFSSTTSNLISQGESHLTSNEPIAPYDKNASTPISITHSTLACSYNNEPGCNNIHNVKESSHLCTDIQERNGVNTGSHMCQRHDPNRTTERHQRPTNQSCNKRRSESCGNVFNHRSSLSFDSSRKALFSLQSRRVNKPDARAYRLPEIQTTTSASKPFTPILKEVDNQFQSIKDDSMAYTKLEISGVKPIPDMVCESMQTKAPTTTAICGLVASMAPADIDSLQDNTDYQLQVSEKDRVVVDRILTELSTPQSFKSGEIMVKHLDGDDPKSPSRLCTKTSTEGGAIIDIHEKQENESATLVATVVAGNNSESMPEAAAAPPLPDLKIQLPITAGSNAFTIEPSAPEMMDVGENKRFEKRSHAFQELITTEQSYINDLDVLVHVHLRVLESKSWFPHSVHSNMLRCVMGLLTIHRKFLSQIQVYNTNEADNDKRTPLKVYRALETSFKVLGQDHKLYTQFCELRMRAINEINRAVGQSIMTGLQKESKELMAQQGRPKSRTDLKDHLIKPIQRICRYPLLLKEILRLTGSGEPEYEFIYQAHEYMRTLALQMDETQKNVERQLLTEQFLKKLPETNFPRKSGAHSVSSLMHSSGTNESYHNYHHQTSGLHPLNSANNLHPHEPPDILFEGGPLGEGILPGALTKSYASTLGSIILAGALEYVIIPDMPIRLRYYGCFLFESMLIIVKAKKMSLYEPRQWLPLRLCELYETTRLDGYTRYGWRIMYDQFRIDFGASCEAERQAWITALQKHIHAAKMAHGRLSRDTAALEPVISSLPWNMARPHPPPHLNSTLQHSSSTGSLTGSGLSRQVQFYHHPPSPTPSPWSACSSAIPSPLMPPPPMATSSTSTTMMMAMSFITNTGEPEKWNDCGTPGISLDAYAQYYDQHIHPHVPDTSSLDQCGSSQHISGCNISINNHVNTPRGYGMAGNRASSSCTSTGSINNSSQQDQCSSPLNRSQSQPRTRLINDSNPLSARRLESSVSGNSGGNLLFPSSPFPWLVSDPRPRSHSFDVTRVFTSNHSGIKPNQRNLVQSMFKDVSTENIWTTTTTATAAANNTHHPQSTPQPLPTGSLSTSLTSRPGRHSTPLQFNYFASSSSTSNYLGGSTALLPPMSPKVPIGTAVTNGTSITTSVVGGVSLGEGDETSLSTPMLHSAGSSCSSLTNRILRRRDSGNEVKCSSNSTTLSSVEKYECDRKRTSGTTTFAATLALNFRKNSDPSTHGSHSHCLATSSLANSQGWGHRRRLSIPDPVAFFNNNYHTSNGNAEHSTSTRNEVSQQASGKRRVETTDNRGIRMHGGMTASFASSPSLATFRNKTKKNGMAPALGSGNLKSSQSSQDLAIDFVASSTPLTSAIGAGEGETTIYSIPNDDLDQEILNRLSSAAADVARSRREGRGCISERNQRQSLGPSLTMTNIHSLSAGNNNSIPLTAITTELMPSSSELKSSPSTITMPIHLEPNISSSHTPLNSPAPTDYAPRDTVEKIRIAMGRLTHKRSSINGVNGKASSGSNHSCSSQHQGSANSPNSNYMDLIESSCPLRQSSIHTCDSHLTPIISSPSSTSIHSNETFSQTSDRRSSTASNMSSRNHYRTVSESTVHSVDSATSQISGRSTSVHNRGILGGVISSSPSSVPQLTLMPLGSTRSRVSSSSSAHSNLLSVYDHSNIMNDHPYHNRDSKFEEQCHPSVRETFSEDHHQFEEIEHANRKDIGTISPRSLSHHSGSSSQSTSSASAISFSRTMHRCNDHQMSSQPQLTTLQGSNHVRCKTDNSSSGAISSTSSLISTLSYDGNSSTQTLHLDSRPNDRRKHLSILQNISQASQKFRTLIRSPTSGIGARRKTAMNLSPMTMDCTNSEDVTVVASEAVNVSRKDDEYGTKTIVDDKVNNGILGSTIGNGWVDEKPLVSDQDINKIFGTTDSLPSLVANNIS